MHDTRLDGETTTGFLGADVAAGRWLMGAAVSHSEADGSFVPGSGDGVAAQSQRRREHPVGRVPLRAPDVERAGVALGPRRRRARDPHCLRRRPDAGRDRHRHEHGRARGAGHDAFAFGGGRYRTRAPVGRVLGADDVRRDPFGDGRRPRGHPDRREPGGGSSSKRSGSLRSVGRAR